MNKTRKGISILSVWNKRRSTNKNNNKLIICSKSHLQLCQNAYFESDRTALLMKHIFII